MIFIIEKQKIKHNKTKKMICTIKKNIREAKIKNCYDLLKAIFLQLKVHLLYFDCT
jgi:hypothetical protein